MGGYPERSGTRQQPPLAFASSYACAGGVRLSRCLCKKRWRGANFLRQALTPCMQARRLSELASYVDSLPPSLSLTSPHVMRPKALATAWRMLSKVRVCASLAGVGRVKRRPSPIARAAATSSRAWQSSAGTLTVRSVPNTAHHHSPQERVHRALKSPSCPQRHEARLRSKV